MPGPCGDGLRLSAFGAQGLPHLDTREKNSGVGLPVVDRAETVALAGNMVWMDDRKEECRLFLCGVKSLNKGRMNKGSLLA